VWRGFVDLTAKPKIQWFEKFRRTNQRKGRAVTMKKKLISMTLVLAAMLIPVSAPAGHFSSYNTSWTVTCTGTVDLSLTLSKKIKGSLSALAVTPTPCASSGSINEVSGVVSTVALPKTWTWEFPGCKSDSTGQADKPSISSKKFDQSIAYNCFGPDGMGGFKLISSGNVTVASPVGVQ
jgi:hypothetical protein